MKDALEALKEARSRRNQRREEEFAQWLQSPLVKMAIGMIPAGDNHDALRLLLRAAFDHGCASGEGSAAAEMMEALMTSERKPR